MAVKCPVCKYANKDGALVCNLCGEKLGAVNKTVQVASLDALGAAAKADVLVEPMAPAGDLWIHCPPFNPVQLPKDRKFTIGRASNNDLVLPVAMVSRNHATIVHDKGKFTLTDLDSANGVYVNGERVQQRVLAAADKVKIEPYHMEILAKNPAAPSLLNEPEAAERTLNISRSELLGGLAGITGKLKEMPLSDVVQMLGQQRKTGALKIRSGPGRGSERGTVYFVEGEVVDARCGDTTGEAAFFKLTELDDGTFQFAGEGARADRTIARKTHNLLMEAMRLKDERGRT